MTRQRLCWTLTALLSLAACHGGRANPNPEGVVGRPATHAQQQRGNLWYRVELQETHLNAAVRLFAPPERTRFFLPSRWAGRDDFSDVIGITGGSTPLGPTDVSIDRKSGEVELNTGEVAWVQLDYRVELTSRSEFHPQLDAGVLVAFGPTFLVTPAQQVLERTTEIPIEFSVPQSLDVVSTWPAHGQSASSTDPSRTIHQFIARDVSELRDAFVVAGPMLRTVRTGADDSLVEVAFAPAFEGDTAEFAELVSSVTDLFRTRFSNAGPVHVYVRTRNSRAGEFGGVGRRAGFILDVPPDTAVSDATRLLVAHEALHIWNGHLLVPAPDVESKTRWFKEGVTHYLALKLLGELDEEFILSELSEIAANYARNPLVRGESGQAIDEARLPYDFGVLVALGFDATLTNASGGRQDLTCWLASLLEQTERPYDEQVLFEALQRCAGPGAGRQLAQQWRRWIRTRERIDLRGLFGALGLHWLPETPHRAAKLIPLDQPSAAYRRLLALERR